MVRYRCLTGSETVRITQTTTVILNTQTQRYKYNTMYSNNETYMRDFYLKTICNIISNIQFKAATFLKCSIFRRAIFENSVHFLRTIKYEINLIPMNTIIGKHLHYRYLLYVSIITNIIKIYLFHL